MSAEDPGFWKSIADYLWAALLLPLGILWKKADGAASGQQLEDHRKEDRESFIKLYENAEEDRTLVRQGFADLSEQLHDAELRQRDKIDELRDEMKK